MKMVIVDRDGVINWDSDRYIKAPEEWLAIPGSLEAIARLNHAGFRVIVASNQSGLGRGYFDIDALNAIHGKMRRELSVLGAQVEAVFFCPHAPDSRCRCRKPFPGLLEDIARRMQVDLRGVPVVGDSYRDIQAAKEIGAFPILVLSGKGKRTMAERAKDLEGVPVYEDLYAAVSSLLV
jgi:D-glycero-D-manno-heptose 1,7-bisphosphate phosphatase